MYIELMLFFFLGLAWFCLFYIVDNIVLIINFKHFDFSEWFFSNSNSNCFFERSSINDFLVDCLMCMYTRFITLLMLKSAASGLILINLQLRFFFYHHLPFFFIFKISTWIYLLVYIMILINFYCKFVSRKVKIRFSV